MVNEVISLIVRVLWPPFPHIISAHVEQVLLLITLTVWRTLC